jgi:mono/diheme cytochrome c family protein
MGACKDDPSQLPVWTPADHAQPAKVDDPTGRAPAGASAQVDLAKTLYMLHCAACHGGGGRGDGPMATGLTVPDLTEESTRAKPDEALLEKIRLGGAGMPAFGGTISPDGMIALLELIRGMPAAE